MLRLPLVGRLLLLVLGLSCAATLAEEATPANPDDARLAELVRKLGADAFDTREEATQELERLGRKAVKALQEGTKSDDMEVARRCDELLQRANRSDLEAALDAFLENKDEKALLKVPAWAKFQKTVGDTTAARNLFVQMCTTEGHLVDLSERDVAAASRLYNERSQAIQQRMFQPFGGRMQMPTRGEVAALLYVGMTDNLRIDQNLRYVVNNILHQPEPQQWLRGDATAQKLFVGYISKQTDVNLAQNHLNMVQQFEIREALPWVTKMAETKSPPNQGYTRGAALGALAKLGGKDAVAKLESFFPDASELQQIHLGGNQIIKSQARDVALAMAVLASGQDLAPYGYPWYAQIAPQLAHNPHIFYQAATQLGFADDAQRTAAFKRYAEWKDKQKAAEPKK